MKKLIIIGAGGNSKVIIDTIQERIHSLGEEIEIIGILDDNTEKRTLNGYSVIGSINFINSLRDDDAMYFVNGIGDNYSRKKIYEQYNNLKYYSVIHPSAIIGQGITIGDGTIIMPGVIINTDSKIGKQALINTGTIIEHDNVIGDFTHLASGTTTAGNVTVGDCSMLGTGTKVIQGLSIGSNTMIGAGSVVIHDIPDNSTAVGVPAKVIKQEGSIAK
jgi:acetyltransferase EpsM